MSLSFCSKKKWRTNRSIRNCKEGGKTMTVIYTGIEDVDKEIQKNINNSIIAYYSDYLIENNTFENQTAIISAEAIEENLHTFLFNLKKLNIRVILLLQKKQKEETKIALQLGIYDILYGNFYPRQVKEIIDNPRTFNDISNLYKKIFDIKDINKSKNSKHLVKGGDAN